LFQDGLPIDESLLTLPLYVHFPKGAHGGTLVQQPTEVYDLTHTVLTALGLKKPVDMHGTDLAAIASGSVEDVQRIRVAITDANYSVRWGDFVLHGEIDKRPALCRLSVDPTCSYDRRHDYPLVWQAMFRRYAAFESDSSKAPDRQPLELDAEAAAMLSVWGAY
jgi:hypothetical protein